jgi:hypothetical protein
MKKILFLTMGAFLLTSGMSTSFAAGGGSSGGSSGSSGGSGGSSNNPVLQCKKGEVVKKVTVNGVTKNKCLPVASGILPDEELYQQGRSLAKAGRYEEALIVLASIKDQNDPRVLNYTGYSNRKAGRIDVGITYYRKALAIDPNFVLAREYLGEGYVAAGKIELAQVELDEIKARAGVNSEEYKDLAKSIATGLSVAE